MLAPSFILLRLVKGISLLRPCPGLEEWGQGHNTTVTIIPHNNMPITRVCQTLRWLSPHGVLKQPDEIGLILLSIKQTKTMSQKV